MADFIQNQHNMWGVVMEPEEEQEAGPVTRRKPENWRNKITNTSQSYNFGSDDDLKYYYSKNLQDLLFPCRSDCFACRTSVFKVGEFHLNEGRLHNIRRRCGCSTCLTDANSKVLHANEMLQDHVYKKLLPYFVFKCFHKCCDRKLRSDELLDHYRDQHGMRKTDCVDCEVAPDMLREGVNIFITNPDKTLLPLCAALSCDLCFRPLSVFPVLSNGKEIICGRCDKPESDDWNEQILYECMTRYLKFPCSRPNCPEVLKVDEVENHDLNCRWAKAMCPLSCKTFKLKVEMSIHIRICHMNECVDRLEVKRQRSLYKIGSEPYIVSIEEVDDDEQHFSCEVHGLDEKDYVDDIHLELVNDDDDGSVVEVFPIQVATLFGNKLNSRDPVRIERRHQNHAFLRLTKVLTDNGGVALDEKSKDELECKVCRNYMTRSIFVCENKHPLCDRCKVKVKCCPICRGVMADDRHSQLENEAVKFKFPCPMQEQNKCQVALTPTFLAKHEAQCRPLDNFPFTDCFVEECNAKFDPYQSDVFFNHCAEHHLDSVMYSGSKEIIEWSTNEASFSERKAVLFFDGELFYITLHCGEKMGLSFSILHVVPSLKKYNFKLELHSRWRTVEKVGSCNKADPLAQDVCLQPEDFNGLLHVGSTTPAGPISIWLEYLVLLEVKGDEDEDENTHVRYVQPTLA